MQYILSVKNNTTNEKKKLFITSHFSPKELLVKFTIEEFLTKLLVNNDEYSSVVFSVFAVNFEMHDKKTCTESGIEKEIKIMCDKGVKYMMKKYSDTIIQYFTKIEHINNSSDEMSLREFCSSVTYSIKKNSQTSDIENNISRSAEHRIDIVDIDNYHEFKSIMTHDIYQKLYDKWFE